MTGGVDHVRGRGEIEAGTMEGGGALVDEGGAGRE